MAECYIGGAGGKKVASGTFVGDDAKTHTIPLDFAPRFVSVSMMTAEYYSSLIQRIIAINYDFTATEGFAFYINNGGDTMMATNLYYAPTNRPSYANGILTLNIITGNNYYFKSGATYEWVATE